MINLMNITLYGKPSSSYEYMKMMIRDNAKNAGIDITIDEVQDVQKIVDDLIEKIPAVKIEDELVERDNEDLNLYIDKANKLILKSEKFGNLKRIIVPIDYSVSSEAALSYAYRFSKYVKGVINLLHVYRPNYDDIAEGIRTTYEDCEEKLKSYEKEISNQFLPRLVNDTVVTSDIESGFPADVILDKSNENENSIVIMGTHGTTGGLSKILGSVSSSVAQKSKVPVLLIPEDCHFTTVDKIMYCSLDPQSDIQIIEELTELAKAFDSEIHVVHVHHKSDDEAYVANDIQNIWKQYYPKNLLKIEVIYGNDVTETINQYALENDIKLMSLSRTKNRLFKNVLKTGLMNKLTKELHLPLLIMSL